MISINTSIHQLLVTAGMIGVFAGQVAAVEPGGGVLTPNTPATGAVVSLAGVANTSVITIEQVYAARKVVETDATLNDVDKRKTLDFYDQAIAGLKDTANLQIQRIVLEGQIRNAPQRIAEIHRLLKALQTPPLESSATAPALSLDQIELKINQDSLNLEQYKSSLHSYEDNLSSLLVGTKSLTDDIATRMQALEQLNKDIAAPPVANDNPSVQKARITALMIRKQVRSAEIDLLKKRLASSLFTDLTQNERDLLVVKISQTEQRLAALKQQEQSQREAQAAAAMAKAVAEVHKAHQAKLPQETQAIVADNAKLRQELEGLVAREQQVNLQLQDAGQMLETLKEDFDRIRQRVEVAGLSRAIGRMLRQRRAALPSLRNYRRESRLRAEQIGKATDRQMEIDDQLRASPLVEHTWSQSYQDSLNELQKVYSRYITCLASLDVAERQLVEVAKAYIAYIDDQLIWIPNIGLTSLLTEEDVLTWDPWLSRIDNWRIAAGDLVNTCSYWPGRILLGGSILVVALLYRRLLWVRLRVISQTMRKIRSDSFHLSLEATVLTALLALPVPLMMVGLGYLLQYLPTAYPFTVAVGIGLYNMGLFLGSLGLVQTLCQDDGLGDRHLRWPAPIRTALLNNLRWFMPLGTVLSFLVAVTAGPETPVLTQTVGGLAFIMLMLATTLLLGRLFKHKGVIKREWLDRNPTHWVSQLRFLWFPILIGVPLTLAITSIIGYHYTAIYLERYVQITVWYFFGLLLLRDLMLRWLFVAERRLRYDNALRRREELRIQRAKGEVPSGEYTGNAMGVEIPEVNYSSLSEQTRHLVHAGFMFGVIIGSWVIWNNLLPALGIINSIELPFHAIRMVDGIPQDVPVTLADAIVGVFVILSTVLAAKNLPGILEIALLQRLTLDAGVRYAVTTLSQYLITAIGIVITFSTLGLQWSSVKWLIAALGVGVGFGLQEIVANFISGIILLFEQPIRVGDVVTIDGTTGVVSRIHIRATTITNYDKQDFIVPNKDFITGRLVNWTLNDTMNRIMISVGIAYGSDVRRAISLLAEVAAENDYVLDDPKPLISFERFGDNALTLNLRCYLENLDNRLATITALHLAIDDKFAAAGINMALSQRDVHLHTGKPLEIRMHQ